MTPSIRQSLGRIAIVVREYDEAIRFYVDVLGFTLTEDVDQPEQQKRWVVVTPPGSTTGLLLARAVSDPAAN